MVAAGAKTRVVKKQTVAMDIHSHTYTYIHIHSQSRFCLQ